MLIGRSSSKEEEGKYEEEEEWEKEKEEQEGEEEEKREEEEEGEEEGAAGATGAAVVRASREFLQSKRPSLGPCPWDVCSQVMLSATKQSAFFSVLSTK